MNPLAHSATPTASASPLSLLRAVWRYRFLLRQLVQRDIASRYRGSLAGLIWSLLLPCVMLAVYMFVFGYVFTPVRRVGQETVNAAFALSLFAGMLLHGLVGECLSRAPAAVLAQPSYVKKVVFPIELLPLAVVGTAMVQFLIGSAVLLLALLFTQGLPATAWLWPLAWLPLLALAAGISFMLAALTVYLRDLAQLTGFVATLLLFLSPVFYSLDSAPPGWQQWLLLNPLTVPIEVTRSLLIKGTGIPLALWGWHAAGCAAALWAGWWIFQRTRKGLADVI